MIQELRNIFTDVDLFNKHINQGKLNEQLKTLGNREFFVIAFRFGLLNLDGFRGRKNVGPKTFQQVADILEITRGRVRQIEEKSLRKLMHRSRWNKFYITNEELNAEEAILKAKKNRACIIVANKENKKFLENVCKKCNIKKNPAIIIAGVGVCNEKRK